MSHSATAPTVISLGIGLSRSGTLNRMGRLPGRVVAVVGLVALAACGFEIKAFGTEFDAGADTDADADAATGVPLLLSIDLWSAPGVPLGVGLSPVFESQLVNYSAAVSVFRRGVLVSAVPIDPTTTITIAGMAVAAGIESSRIMLTPGANPITVVAHALDGTETTYTVDVARRTITQEAYIKASNTVAADDFGNAIARSGDTLVIGAPYEDTTAANSGAAYVFTRTGSTWTEQAHLKASNAGTNDEFGRAVAIDGNTLAVGASREDSNATGVGGNQADNGGADSGAVYVFTRTGTTWSQQAYIKASNTGADDSFGNWVAIVGTTLAVGAPFEDSNATGINGNQGSNSASDSGAAYVFTRAGNTWSQQAYVKASNTGGIDNFGFNLAVSGDTLVVGSEHEDSAATGIGGDQTDNSAGDSGAAYVYLRSGTTWSQQAYLKASNTGAGDIFGDSIALAGDTLVVGARKEDSAAVGIDGDGANDNALDSGAAYVFRRNGTTWIQQAYLKASNTEAGDELGISAGIARDLIVIGAGTEDGAASGPGGDPASNSAADSGAAYVFGQTATSWSQLIYLKASNTGANDLFGYLFALTDDALVVCSPFEDSSATGIGGNQLDEAASNSGAAYGFR